MEVVRPDDMSRESNEDDLEVYVRGNELLLDEVLVWVMNLPDEGPATEQMALDAEERLQAFLSATGYDLARVRALVHEGALYVFVDEGKLDKIFFTGSGTAQALNFHLELSLPQNIYNRAKLQEELARIKEKYGLEELRAELIQSDPKPATVIQLDEFISALESDDEDVEEVWVQSRGSYSLRVHSVSQGWGEGLSYGARYLLPYGLQPQISYAGSELFGDDDRYKVSAEVAGLTNELFNQASGRLYWAAEPIGGQWLRPTLDGRVRLTGLERDSINLEEYYELRLNGVISVGVEPVERMVISTGIGYGYEDIFALQRNEFTPDYVTGEARHFPLGRVRLDWLIGAEGFRRDKRHELNAEVTIFNVDQGMVRRATLDYQKVWELGYQDLFVRANAATVNGAGVRWRDEEPIASDIIRAVAGEQNFARNALQFGPEFRLSLHRDILKASLSAGGAAAWLVDRDSREQFLEFFVSGGPGLHLLVLDNFQANAYYSFGWRDDGLSEGVFSFAIKKVF